MHGSWKERSSDVVDLSEFDEHTIECALSYFYARDYPSSTFAHTLDPELEQGAKEESHETFATEHVHTGGSEDDNIPDELTKEGSANRPLTPIENLIKPITRAVLSAATARTPSPTKDLLQSLATEALTHAKVYTFAHVYRVLELEDFALHRLAKVLITLQDKEFEMLPQLAEAIRVIYCKTPKDCNNPATNLMSHFVATRFNWLIGDHLYALMAEGGDFAKDVSNKLARRLSVNPLKVKVKELNREIAALKVQCAELHNEPDSMRNGGTFRRVAGLGHYYQ
ncbi:uncharacterized protein N7503_007850 [Penicillium pulvis]|uniref:uncharacterized protein n=1 Tax=Penicillium pulvis TaxID=1562058 RepID=UPI0025478BF4|nr:uncharacterized protein N7503_007850 [Penicillium pulvis]KAJ5798554.1 hypothetical protein N7503_007850 [Penicillium pulvis]